MMRPPRNKPEPLPTLEEMKHQYLSWLYNKMVKEEDQNKYWLLANYLFRIPFRWSIPNDDNRAADGVKFRGDFIVKKTKTYDIWWDAPCSVFEMLVGLACRMEDILENPYRASFVGDWLVLMFSNLGIQSYTDSNWSSDVEKIIDRKIDLFLDRQYDRDGNGGLFPLEKNGVKDQRKVEIWYQLMKYIDESFDI